MLNPSKYTIFEGSRHTPVDIFEVSEQHRTAVYGCTVLSRRMFSGFTMLILVGSLCLFLNIIAGLLLQKILILSGLIVSSMSDACDGSHAV